MKDLFAIIQNEIQSGRPISLVTVVEVEGSAPQRVGAKMLVSKEGTLLWGTVGGGTIEALALEQAKIQINEQKPLLKSFNLIEKGEEATGMLCGGKMKLFFDIYGIQTKMYIFGAGHITQQLLPLLTKLGFSAVVIDDRQGYLEEHIEEEYKYQVIEHTVVQFVEKLQIDPQSYIIILTYSHDLDEKILKYLLIKKQKEISTLKYLGMIGSKRKIKEIFSRLEAEGIEKSLLNLVHAPIGIPIRSQTPEEIAISIAAELISVRNTEEK
jgi:xanthine dehydrogenase accessory factor